MYLRILLLKKESKTDPAGVETRDLETPEVFRASRQTWRMISDVLGACT